MKFTTLKTSTIFIGAGDKMRVYRSPREIPPSLRKQLEKSTSGTNTATILIADKRGREEILRALEEREKAKALRTTTADLLRGAGAGSDGISYRWLRIGAAAVLASLLATIFTLVWSTR